MSCKIFISHANSDREYAIFLYDFLTYGLGIYPEDIFCSSIPGSNIPQGEDFDFFILNKLKESSECYTIAIISDAYYNSNYCLYELGAAWGLSKSNNNILPFLVEDMDRGSPKDFLRNKQNIIGENPNDISDLKDLFSDDPNIRKSIVATQRFESEKVKLLAAIKTLNAERSNANRIRRNPENRTQRIKLVAFDFDGTILQGKEYKHSWIEIWKFLKYPKSVRIELEKRHYNPSNDFKFQDWCDACVAKFKEQKFKKEHIYEIIKEQKLELAKNFEDVVRVLKAFGIKIIIISGGINTFIEATIGEDLIEFIDEVYVNNFFYNDEGFLEGVDAYQNEYSDTFGKAKMLESYCVENDILLSEVAYVGERMNDIEVLKSVSKPIIYPAKKAHPNLTSKHSKFAMVHDESMVHILPHILD